MASFVFRDPNTSKALQFNEDDFRLQVQNSVDRVRQILAANRYPKYAKDIRHHYDDKYNLVHYLTNMVNKYTML